MCCHSCIKYYSIKYLASTSQYNVSGFTYYYTTVFNDHLGVDEHKTTVKMFDFTLLTLKQHHTCTLQYALIQLNLQKMYIKQRHGIRSFTVYMYLNLQDEAHQ